MNPSPTLDAMIANLRAQGFGKMTCVRVVRHTFDLPLHDAHRLVHGSPAFADVADEDAALQDALCDVLEAL